jgi:hypothetical protein
MAAPPRPADKHAPLTDRPCSVRSGQDNEDALAVEAATSPSQPLTAKPASPATTTDSASDATPPPFDSWAPPTGGALPQPQPQPEPQPEPKQSPAHADDDDSVPALRDDERSSSLSQNTEEALVASAAALQARGFDVVARPNPVTETKRRAM